MKHASLLIALCVLLSLPAFAQSTTTVEKNANRITITTKKVDDSGKTITETYIAEGDEPTKILQEMAINPAMVQKVEVINENNNQNQERLFLYRNAGDNVVIEGTLEENVENEINAENATYERIVIINNSEGADKPACIQKFRTAAPHGKWDDHSVVYAYGGHDRKSNCAALGVYVNNEGDQGGSRINSLIDQGGAQAAGLKEGDLLTKIDEFDINDFSTLHLALSHFQPGDVVTVRYTRDDKKMKSKVELKDWAQLPGHEWRARTDCGEPKSLKQDNPEDLKKDNPIGLTGIETLRLDDVRMYPNPTDGLFALSFSLEPGPVTVSITDINGKVIFTENNENNGGAYNRDIDLKNVPQGNYILTVKQGDRIYTDQIAKQ